MATTLLLPRMSRSRSMDSPPMPHWLANVCRVDWHHDSAGRPQASSALLRCPRLQLPGGQDGRQNVLQGRHSAFAILERSHTAARSVQPVMALS